MEGMFSGCMICGAPLEYFPEAREMECAVCRGRFVTNAACVDGHFVCDGCHSKVSFRDVCLSSDSRDPVWIAERLMSLPGVHMHGPEHHVIAGSALLTAYRNAGGDIDLGRSLEEMDRRGRQVPGGACGMWGCCGAAVSCGIAYSIATSSTPLSGATWGDCNLMTSRCLEAIGSLGGPRCCKRDTYTALLTASRFLEERTGVRLDVPESVTCSRSAGNPQCIGARCPYHKG